jgi:hypothetical protein
MTENAFMLATLNPGLVDIEKGTTSPRKAGAEGRGYLNLTLCRTVSRWRVGG